MSDLFGDLAAEQPTLFIQVLLELFIRQPACGKRALVRLFIGCLELPLNAEPGLGLEVFDGVVPLGHQAQNRSLYPADGIDPLLTLMLVSQGIKACQVDAV